MTTLPLDGVAHRRAFTITCVRRDPDHGFWTAHVTANGDTLCADRRHGSWQFVVGESRREVLPFVALALQERVRPLERAEKRDERECG